MASVNILAICMTVLMVLPIHMAGGAPFPPSGTEDVENTVAYQQQRGGDTSSENDSEELETADVTLAEQFLMSSVLLDAVKLTLLLFYGLLSAAVCIAMIYLFARSYYIALKRSKRDSNIVNDNRDQVNQPEVRPYELLTPFHIDEEGGSVNSSEEAKENGRY